MPNLVGQSLGRYNILEQIGEGGMATVYKAYDTHLERDVAIKIIRRKAFPEEQLERILKRFEREAKALARLTHPNIVPLIDYGEYEGAPYLVMIYLPGGALKQPPGTQMPWQEAVRILLPVAEALAYAHGHNVIHRDIKPSNILLTEKGQPLLADFGIAKIVGGDETATLTGTGAGVGTPGYMAPEQWTGHTVPQSDIYSLGVVLYELVTGRKPYTGDTPAAILLKQATEPLLKPSQFAPGLPGPVEELLQKALAREPMGRYADMAGLIGALEALLTAAPQTVRPSLLLRKETPKVPLEQSNEEKKRQEEAAQARREAEEKARYQAEITRLSGQTRSAIEKNNWVKTEQHAAELAGLGETGKVAAAGLLEQMKERQATQQARELARLQAEEQAKIEDARRIEELRKKKEKKAAEQERLKEAAAKSRETAAHLAAEEKSRREAQAHAQRLAEISGLQPEIEKALVAQQWGTARQLISQLKNLGPEGQSLMDGLQKRLTKPKLPRWAWVVGGLILVGIIIGMGWSFGRKLMAQTSQFNAPGLANQTTEYPVPGMESSAVPLAASSLPITTPSPLSAQIPTDTPFTNHTESPTYTPEYTPTATLSFQAVLLNNANIRSGPGTAYPILTVYLAGTTVQILGRNHAGDWLALAMPGNKRGWVAISSLRSSFDVSAMAELQAPPPPTQPPLPTATFSAPQHPATPTWAK
jgi:serine/threonine protein kinase